MKNNKLKNTTGESFGIPERRSEGVAGPSREVSRRDAVASGPDEAGLANNTVGKSDTQRKSTHTAPQLVERKTELRGLHIGATRQPKSTIRRQTEQDLYCPDPEVTYVKAERANHDLVCTLMERQDRMNEAIFLKINDFGYRLEDVEEWKDAKLEKQGRTR